jgi:selenocysteine-specific elongation factor
VVTGTLWSGTIGEGDGLAILPAGRAARVRSVEVHDERVTSAAAGQRVAVNLAGVGADAVARGDVLAGGPLRPTFIVDAALDTRIEHGTRATVHHGTRETPARIAWLGGRFHQLRCERPLMAARGDRLVIRSIAPPDTLGGGVVLDPAARKHGPARDVLARLERLARGEAAEPRPRRPSPPRPVGPVPLDAAALALEERLRAAWLEAPAFADLDADALAALRAHDRARRVGPFAFHADAVAQVEDRVRALVAAEGAVTLARLRDELATSRRYAQALIEHLDATRVTRRLPDDSRVLRRASPAG